MKRDLLAALALLFALAGWGSAIAILAHGTAAVAQADDDGDDDEGDDDDGD